MGCNCSRVIQFALLHIKGDIVKKKTEESAPTDLLAVGEKLELSADEVVSIKEAENLILNLQLALGSKREQFLTAEMELFKALADARNAYLKAVTLVGESKGLSFEGTETYDFDSIAGAFTRSK
jgi:hypothetical protein